MIDEVCTRAYQCVSEHTGVPPTESTNVGALVLVVLSGILLYCFVVYVIADAMLRGKGYRS